ncbi:hypothetical protein GCM10027048_00100 [Hymenobacter coalescens]
MPSIPDILAAALPAFAADEADDESVQQFLLAQGVDEALANQVVAFLPLAFGRIVLEQLSLQFSEEYSRVGASGRIHSGYSLAAEPVFLAATSLARQLVATGQWSQELHWPVAMWSAEFHAVNNLLNAGSQAENVELSPPVLLWNMDDSAVAAKPWWKFW